MRVIVCGAGIAGLATALWLGRRGVEVQVLERGAQPPRQGYMIDFFGPGFDAMEEAGLLPQLRHRGYPVTRAVYRDARGRIRARIDDGSIAAAMGDNLVSIMRPDLESVLREALPAGVSLRYGAGVQSIRDDGDEVTVTTMDGTSLRADLLVGADGIHSTVRRQVFGPDEDFVRYLGFHTAAYTFTDAELSRQVSGEFALTDSVGRMLGCYGLRDGEVAVFAVHRTLHATVPADVAATIRGTYDGLGWITPRLLAACPPSEEVFYDQVSQVSMPAWSRGRVVLVGDACGAVSLLAGQGASMAVTGGRVLGTRVADASGTGDIPRALRDYQATMRPLIDDRQESGRRTARWFVPSSRPALVVRRAVLAAARLPGFDRLATRRLTGKPSAITAETRATISSRADHEPADREPAGHEPGGHEPGGREPERHGAARSPITSRRPTGLLRHLLRLPIWLYHAHLGWMLGHRMIYIAHRGRRSGARREVVVEVVRYDPDIPEVFVIAAWGGTPDWYRNLRAAPAIEVRTGRHRWPAPDQRFPDAEEVLQVLRAYQRAHPAAFGQLGPRLGFPADPADPRWPEVAGRVHAVTFRPAARRPLGVAGDAERAR